MTIATSLDPNLYTDMQGLAELRGRARAEGDTHSPETLRKVAGQFEALFVHMMLKSMREASLGEGAFDSEQSQFYQGMYDQQLALEISKGKGLGLADVLVRQLGGSSAASPQPTRSAEVMDPFLGQRLSGRRSATSTPQRALSDAAPPSQVGPAALEPVQAHWRPDSKAGFVADLWPYAQQAAQQLGVDVRVILAQAALESGWGQRVMARADGRSSHNLFGIKADSRWQGEQAQARTLEYREGRLQREQAQFRAYAHPGQSVADYADFIASNPRYTAALGVRDAGRYAAELQQAGYATDPHYAKKIMSIFNSKEFQTAIAGAKYQAQQAANLETGRGHMQQTEHSELAFQQGLPSELSLREGGR